MVQVRFPFSGGLNVIRKLARTRFAGVAMCVRHLLTIEMPDATLRVRLSAIAAEHRPAQAGL